MELPKDLKLGPLLPYIYDYIVGVWWLAVGAVTFGTGADVTACLASIESWHAAAPNVHPPEFAINFLLVIATGTLPYCIALAVFPILMILMNAVRRVQRRIVYRQPKPPAAVAGDMRRSFIEALTRLNLVDRRAAEGLRRSYLHILLRVGTTIPTGVLLGYIIARTLSHALIASCANSVGVLVGLATVVLLLWTANTAYDEFLEGLGSTLRLLEMRDARRRRLPLPPQPPVARPPGVP